MAGWSALQLGDWVDVVAPASACLDPELRKAVKYLEDLGLNPRVPRDLFRRRFVFSNSDEYRYRHLAKALTDEKSKAVWCIRGGYGSVRLLPMLSKLKKPRRPKLFIGLSDITSVHGFLNQEWKWPTIHGPVLARMGAGVSPAREKLEVRKLIFGSLDKIDFKLKPMNRAARSRKKIRSTVVGGNLETISAVQGTKWQLETRGKILFVEEVNERGYRVDRRFQNLKLSGQLDRSSAIVFGDFIGGAEPDNGKKMWKEAIHELAQSLEIPVFNGIHSGHGPLQRPVPFQTRATIDKSVLSCETGRA